MAKHNFVMLSTADWDNPFWTNKQHVAVELVRLGHHVLYVDSVGLRRPSGSAADLKRVVRRLIKGLLPPRLVRKNLWVYSPLLIPFHGNSFVRWINPYILSTFLGFWSRVIGFRQKILWTYNPITTQLLATDSYDAVVYHCVDEVKAQPGMPAALIAERENELLKTSDVVFVTADGLLAERKAVNERTLYYPNVADYAHFNSATSDHVDIPNEIAELKGPVLGFIGAISSYKIDFDLLRQLAIARPDWNIVLIGKVGEGDPSTTVDSLLDLENVHLLGPREYKDLPGYLKGFDVALMPNNINDYTHGMFPMKFFEYLASGCPVISVPLDSLKEYVHICRFAHDAAGFVREIERSLASSDSEMVKLGLVEASKNTYESRTRLMLLDLEDALVNRRQTLPRC